MLWKICSIALIVVGIAVFVSAIVSLISERLSLSPWSVETEGRYVAYGLHAWGYWAGELPLSLALLVIGILLWPPRPRSLVTKVQGFLSLVIALVGIVVLARTAYSWPGMELGPSLPLPYVLLGVVVKFVPMLAITILAAVAAVQRLSILRREKTW